MRVLVVGSGGREHALCWTLARSASVDEVIAAPGNPGIESVGRCVSIDPKDPAAVAQLADDLDANLVLGGSEESLVRGLVDAVQARGRHAFGPTAQAAHLEGSKAWMKEVVAEAGVPTARHATFTAADQDAALQFLTTLDGLYVVKTDGLAGGKGVVVTESLDEARDAVRAYLSGSAFGDAGRTLVIEEGMRGPELSLLVVCNGDVDGAAPLAPAQDFKRIGDGDVGPNTGGMGAYSPVPIVGDGVVEQVMVEAVRPTLRALAARGIEYRGILYAGLMLTAVGPKLVEYNVRFGDPECQVVVPRLTTDLGELCLASASGKPLPEVRCSTDAWVTVVLASESYPASPRTGDPIEGLDAAEALPSVVLFHAGTARDDRGRLVTAGGRVLNVTASAPTLGEARDRAYGAAALINWPGMQFRHDIAAEAAGVSA
ncbi:MAG: phosphoribosylamine--glycine ligase [Acidimicrobiia bacterium]|nr:phosphoribosylamine--glycine ligase [Acidimicrobiia bacterium]